MICRLKGNKKVEITNSIVYTNAQSQSDSMININNCSEEELEEIYGINVIRAKKIIAIRPIRSFIQIQKIKGIGRKTINQIKKRVDFDDIDSTDSNSSAS